MINELDFVKSILENNTKIVNWTETDEDAYYGNRTRHHYSENRIFLPGLEYSLKFDGTNPSELHIVGCGIDLALSKDDYMLSTKESPLANEDVRKTLPYLEENANKVKRVLEETAGILFNGKEVGIFADAENSIYSGFGPYAYLMRVESGKWGYNELYEFLNDYKGNLPKGDSI